MFCGSRVETTLGDIMAYTLGREGILERGVAAVFDYRRGRNKNPSRSYYTQPGIATTAQLMDGIFTLGGGGMSKKRCNMYGAAVECLCELVWRVHFRTVDRDELELFYLQRVPPADLEGDLAKIDENRHKCITKAKKQSRWRPPFDVFLCCVHCT
jgi:hypothetical protein